jgi:hypothetical protein
MVSFKNLFYERKNDLKYAESAETVWFDVVKTIKSNPDESVLEWVHFTEDELNDGRACQGLAITLDKLDKNLDGELYFMIDCEDHAGFYSEETNSIYLSPNELMYDRYLSDLDYGSEEFKEAFIKHFGRLYDEDTFIHEFVHYLDHNNYEVFDKIKYHEYGESEEEKIAYYNNQTEINARFIETLAKLKYQIDSYDSFNHFLGDFMNEWERVHGYVEYITDENKKRIAKRLFQYWSDNK